MRIPLSWLREMTPLRTDADELAAVLAALGLPVVSVERVGAGLGSIVVAEVLAIAPIEGADRIRHVTVDAGGRELGIVCGAWNFEVGDRVPLAPVGAVLPGGLEIGRRKMRGVVSEGMLCSGRELGLSDDGAGLLVLGRGAAAGAGAGGGPGGGGGGAAAPGTPIVEALGIVPDVVLDVDVPPNRPDCLSVAGIARDLAASLRLPFELPDPVVATAGTPAADLAAVVVESPELCTRLTARVLSGVLPVPSTGEVARRLLLCGMRSIDSRVDASNYVMLELGQPTHPYDLDRLGPGLVARAARHGERLVTIDGVERALDVDDCVIADPDGRAVGLAGVMGGGGTEIVPGTTRVLLEAAHFVPLAVASTARRLGLHSEASLRFERGCDPEMPELAGRRYAALLVEAALAAGMPPPVLAPGMLDARPVAPAPLRITLRTYRVNALLGTELDDSAVRGYLKPLGFGVAAAGRGVSDVTAPSFRPDVAGEAEVLEEIARLHGYERIPALPRRAPASASLTPFQRHRRELRRALGALGAHETWTPLVAGPGTAGEQPPLRRSLLPGLLAVLARNAGRRNPHVRLFEIGRVYEHETHRAHGDAEVAAAVLGLEDDGAEAAVRAWRLVADALGLEGVQILAAEVEGLHATRAARLVASGGGPEEVLGALGEVDAAAATAAGLPDRRIGWLELWTVPLLTRAAVRRPAPGPSRYPSSDVDLAFAVAEETPAAAVEACLRDAAAELCESVELFDVYRGPGVAGGERSLAFRLRLCAPDRTLTEAEIAAAREACVTAVEGSLPARLRG